MLSARFRRCAPGRQAFAVVKANAYGHGVREVVTALHDVADGFAVASLEEAAAGGAPLPVRNRSIVELLYATGIRVGELAGLDVDDLDPDRRTLRVIGKGNKERTVPYGVPAAVALDDWLRRGRPLLATERSGSIALTTGSAMKWSAVVLPAMRSSSSRAALRPMSRPFWSMLVRSFWV